MDNPFELQAPADPIERIHALARDLAYGALTGQWPTKIPLIEHGDGSGSGSMRMTLVLQDSEIAEALLTKWTGENLATKFGLLRSFGYLEPAPDGYIITRKAFDLLAKPVLPPAVFISYGRKQSSAFALLLECKLASIGVKAFVDRSIDPGTEWHNQLQKSVHGATYLVSLVAPGTLASPYVREEIRWALDAGVRCIPVWHNGFVFNRADLPDCPDWLETFITAKHAIRVQEESAEGYFDAAAKVLNRLGYFTI